MSVTVSTLASECFPELAGLLQNETHCSFGVEHGVNGGDVVYDIVQQVGLPNGRLGGAEPQVSEVDMKVVVGWLVVEIGSKTVLVHSILVTDLPL